MRASIARVEGDFPRVFGTCVMYPEREETDMIRAIALLVAAGLMCGGAHAATINTTLTVTNAPVSVGASGFAINNAPATLSGIGSATFTATLSLTGSTAPFTIRFANGDTITGNLSIPASALTGATSGTGSATITGGTGTYAGATGSFPQLSA